MLVVHELRLRQRSPASSTLVAVLADVAVILQNGSPYMATGVSFGDTLQKVHEKRGASLLVLSSLLRDVRLF